MTTARIQHLCNAPFSNLGFFDRKRVNRRAGAERNKALVLGDNHFCLNWRPQCISCKEAIEEVKVNFKIVDNFISHDNVNN